MKDYKRENGFLGEKQINVPAEVINQYIRRKPFINSLYINHIGYFPNAEFHYQKRDSGCADYILIYCLDGKGHCETKNGSFVIQSNQFILLPPQQFHCYQADLENPWSIYWVQFSGSMMNELKEDFDLGKYEVPTNLSFNSQTIELWQEMYSSLIDGYTDENIGYANLCLYRFFSYFLYPNKAQKQIKETQTKDQLDEFIAYMQANVHKRLTADEIAAVFHYSSSHFSVLFKQKTGLSPIDYFIRIKVRYACQLLTQSNLIIKEIAEKVGYDDPYYFSRIFRKMTGKSPLEYKRYHELGSSRKLSSKRELVAF